jgi:hypothetical protein
MLMSRRQFKKWWYKEGGYSPHCSWKEIYEAYAKRTPLWFWSV